MRPITINNVLLSHFYKQFISTLDMTENRFHWFSGTIFSLTSQAQGAILFTCWVYIDTPLHPLVESKCRDGQNFWLHYLREQDNCQVYITIQDVVTAHKKKQNQPTTWPENLQLWNSWLGRHCMAGDSSPNIILRFFIAKSLKHIFGYQVCLESYWSGSYIDYDLLWKILCVSLDKAVEKRCALIQ